MARAARFLYHQGGSPLKNSPMATRRLRIGRTIGAWNPGSDPAIAGRSRATGVSWSGSIAGAPARGLRCRRDNRTYRVFLAQLPNRNATSAGVSPPLMMAQARARSTRFSGVMSRRPNLYSSAALTRTPMSASRASSSERRSARTRRRSESRCSPQVCLDMLNRVGTGSSRRTRVLPLPRSGTSIAPICTPTVPEVRAAWFR